jgi:hypothetical protein
MTEDQIGAVIFLGWIALMILIVRGRTSVSLGWEAGRIRGHRRAASLPREIREIRVIRG